MANAWLRHLADEKVLLLSAGRRSHSLILINKTPEAKGRLLQ